jgi:hypothetical protein
MSKESMLAHISRILEMQEVKENISICKELDKLKGQALYKATDDEKIRFSIKQYLRAEFRGNFVNSVQVADSFVLNFKIHDNRLVETSGANNELLNGVLNKTTENLFFKSAFLIDTPLFLGSVGGNEYHQRILCLRLNGELKKDMGQKNNKNIVDDIMKILGGASFVYNETNDELEYKVSENASRLKMSNIASGAKSFGTLMLLLKTGLLKKASSLLILDEPENHLHPEWQIVYAHCIARMVSEGFYVLITSHSPEFIHALKRYSHKYGIFDDKVNFYLARQIENENYAEISDMTKSTNAIFADLSAPSEKLFQSYNE